MIITIPYKNNRILTYSDQGLKIKQLETGNIYDYASDSQKVNYTYEEIDIPRDFEMEIENNYEKIIDILTGEEGEV